MIEAPHPLEGEAQVRRASLTRSKLQVAFPSFGSRSGHGSRGECYGPAVDHHKCLAKRVQSAYRYIKQHSVEGHS